MQRKIRHNGSSQCQPPHIENLSDKFQSEVDQKSGHRREEYAAQIVTKRSQYSRHHSILPTKHCLRDTCPAPIINQSRMRIQAQKFFAAAQKLLRFSEIIVEIETNGRKIVVLVHLEEIVLFAGVFYSVLFQGLVHV